MTGTPASPWPLWLRRLICRFRGHIEIDLTKHRVAHVMTGTGCVRCEAGTIREYRGQYPLPRR